MSSPALPTLWHLKVSHYNEKARWALDYKRMPHVRRAAIPGRQAAIAKKLGAGSTFPVLVLDGEAIGDSTRIIAALLSPAVAPEQFSYPQPQRGHPGYGPLREAVAEHGLDDWAREIYARHRGRSAEVSP